MPTLSRRINAVRASKPGISQTGVTRPKLKRRLDDEKRRKLYDGGGILHPGPVINVDAESHTMGSDNLKDYLGRKGCEGLQLKPKKLNPSQCELLKQAYRNGLRISVIGAFRDDLGFLLESNRMTLLGESVPYDKPKLFNSRRQVMCLVGAEGTQRPTELWVLVFPSHQYVCQVAQLLQGIVDDFASKEIPDEPGCRVVVSHFRNLEGDIAEWTGFRDFVRPYLRHGDVVMIGNVDHLATGLNDCSFQLSEDSYTFGGLDDMFGIATLVHSRSYRRLVVVGIKECFWGDASAQYVRALLDGGAMHILYGSKAASTVHKDDVHTIYAPKHFVLIDKDGNPTEVPYEQGNLPTITHHPEIFNTGYVATVPTVIGETHEQRASIKRVGPTCMDCEDGHIAAVVADFNAQFTSSSSSLAWQSFKRRFIPIHFITDYIYNSWETVDPTTGHLGIKASEIYCKRRDAAYRTIGSVFGNYALAFGISDVPFSVESIASSVHPNEKGFDREFARFRDLVDAGCGEKALAQLACGREGDHYRIDAAMVHALVCQKEGYVHSAWSAIAKIESSVLQDVLGGRQKTIVKVIKLKLNAQVGCVGGLKTLIEALDDEASQSFLVDIKQFGAVKRREAIYHALVGDRGRAKASIANAHDQDGDRDGKYRQSNVFYDTLTDLPFTREVDLEAISDRLSQVRRIYWSSDSSKCCWQTNFERSALASLYMEAAFYLCSKVKDLMAQGIRLLAMADLYNNDRGANELAETFGEIIACTTDPQVKNILALAMRRDLWAKSTYSMWLGSKFSALPELAAAFKDILALEPCLREAELRKLISSPLPSKSNASSSDTQLLLF